MGKPGKPGKSKVDLQQDESNTGSRGKLLTETTFSHIQTMMSPRNSVKWDNQGVEELLSKDKAIGKKLAWTQLVKNKVTESPVIGEEQSISNWRDFETKQYIDR